VYDLNEKEQRVYGLRMLGFHYLPLRTEASPYLEELCAICLTRRYCGGVGIVTKGCVVAADSLV
jgi:hypothetical protein